MGFVHPQRDGLLNELEVDQGAVTERTLHQFRIAGKRARYIAELAGKFGLDVTVLEKTVADFNAAVRPGTFDHTILDDCRTEGLSPPKTACRRSKNV